MKKYLVILLTLILLATPLTTLAAGNDNEPQGAAELRGTVLDETRAYMVAIPVVLDDGKGNKYTTQTDEKGQYRFIGVKPGIYTLTVEAEGFAAFSEQIDLTGRPRAPFDVVLKVFIAEQVEVKDTEAAISAEPDKNLSAVTLTAKELEALPDDPDELLNTLRQMAGAGAGDDAAVYVGGFRERGQLPPKESIQMIRINSNPFAAEFSEPGFSRIEIVTKPGSDTFHGSFRFNFNDESLNARNAFADIKAPTQNRNYNGSFTGPIIRNRWGFFINVDRRAAEENVFVNALTVNPQTFATEPFVTTVLTPRTNTNFEIRTDFLATKKHTIGLGYRISKSNAENQGLDELSLPERAFNRETREDTVRFSLTTIATERAVNEARLQLSRRSNNSRALTDAVAITVLDAFNAGGNQGSLFLDSSTDNLDFTNNLTYTHNKHTIKLGVRAEVTQLENINRSNFGGSFTFSSLEQYRRVLRGDAGARPSQFSINRGDPFISLNQWETGFFLQDDWRVSNRLTLSYGLRSEFQTNLQDKLNVAPRFGIVWAQKDGKGTVRGGAGVFYNRVDNGITFDTIRFDGTRQLQFTITNPNFFPDVPTNPGGTARPSTIREKAEDLNMPYSINTTIGYERQLPWKLFGSATYSWNRGVHLLRSRNINAPTLGASGDPVFPFPGQGAILLYESTGFSNRHELRLSLRTNFNPKLTLFGFYTLSSTKSDTDGAGSQPANPFDLTNEYGRAGFDARHQFFVSGSMTLPWNLRVTPYLRGNTGRPFNITTGRDDNRDLSFADRPSFGRLGEAGVIATRFGIFDPTPEIGDLIIPRNFGDGPGLISANLGISKTFGFGPAAGNFPGQSARNGNQSGGQGQNQRGGNNQSSNRGGNSSSGNRGGGGGFGGGAVMRGGGGGFGGPGGFFNDSRNKYSVTVSVNFSNIFNHVNLGRFNGVLTSPRFGQANSTASGGGFGGFGGNDGSRRIDASVAFRF